MKTNKQKSTDKSTQTQDFELLRQKRKNAITSSKVNVKSKKFWEKIVDDEGEDIEKYLR